MAFAAADVIKNDKNVYVLIVLRIALELKLVQCAYCNTNRLGYSVMNTKLIIIILLSSS